MDNDILIALLAQIPIALYTIVAGILNFRSNQKKTQADAASSFGNAIRGAGETLEDAWLEIRTLRVELKDEREARELLEKHVRRWTRHAVQLTKQLVDAGIEPHPYPPDSQDLTKLVRKDDDPRND